MEWLTQRPIEPCLRSSLVSSTPAYSNLNIHIHFESAKKRGKPGCQPQSSVPGPERRLPLYFTTGWVLPSLEDSGLSGRKDHLDGEN